MSESRIKNRYKKFSSRVRQGDILKNISIVLGFSTSDEKKVLPSYFNFNYGIVVSQDCDLLSDYRERKNNSPDKKQDKYLPTILICPAYLWEDFKEGKHFENWSMQAFNSSNYKKLQKNDEYKRFHYLPGEVKFFIPELVIDFKHFITIPRDSLYKKRNKIYTVSLNELFREELSQRFTNYLSRIGLPEI